MPLLADDHHRAGRVGGDLRADRPQQQGGEAADSPGTKDHLFRIRQLKKFGGRVAQKEPTLNRQAGQGPGGAQDRAVKHVLAVTFQDGVEIGYRVGQERRPPIHDMDDRQRGSTSPGIGNGPVEGLLACLRLVHAHEDR